MIEFLSGRWSGTDTVVNVATIEFSFRAIVLIEKFMLDVAYKKIGVAKFVFAQEIEIAKNLKCVLTVLNVWR